MTKKLLEQDRRTLPGGVRIGSALLSKRGEVIATGYNSWKSHPLQAKFARNVHSIYLHAETDMLRNANGIHIDTIARSTVLVVRILADGSYGMARPCSGCLKALEAFGIRKVHFTLTGENRVGVEEIGTR